MHFTLIRPTVTYASETLVLKEYMINTVMTFESKFDVHVTVHRKLGKAVNQLDATKKEFYSVFLAQHVSGINMPIIRSTIQHMMSSTGIAA
jgi:hypothetical protein